MAYIKGYITNLGKYNEGELVGEWIQFPISEDELQEVFERIGINEYYEEFFMTDFESDLDGLADYFDEYDSIESINDVAEIIDNLSSYEEDVFNAAVGVFGLRDVLSCDLDDYRLYEDIFTDYDLGYYWIEESGCYDLSKMGNLANYFDYESFGRDIRLESNGDFCRKGYIEYIG